MIKNNNLTATEEVLLAAYSLTRKNKKEFTEWDLTVETWLLNKNRWGLKGYENKYPDHKRVMNEVMASGTNKVVGKGWLEKTKPNYYKMTPLGLIKSSSLSDQDMKSDLRSFYQYESIKSYIFHPSFKRYCINPKEPKTWLDVAAFLGLKKYNENTLNIKIKSIYDSIQNSLDWIKENNTNALRRDDREEPISKEEILKLREFMEVIEQRFKSQFDAIRSKK